MPSNLEPKNEAPAGGGTLSFGSLNAILHGGFLLAPCPKEKFKKKLDKDKWGLFIKKTNLLYIHFMSSEITRVKEGGDGVRIGRKGRK